MLTSSGQGSDEARAREHGIAACLTKPVKQSDLLDTIISVTNGRTTEPEEVQALPTTEPAVESSNRLRILLAEDNAVNQILALRLLNQQGHDVAVVTNGRDATHALEQNAFDLVLMDLQMPEMGGFEATKKIRHREQATGGHIPIIAMTAHALKGDRERCLEAGMDGYVAKPIDPERLFEAIAEAYGVTQNVVTTTEGRDSADFIDDAALLKRFAGNTGLLQEVAEIFLEDLPTHMIEIKNALDLKDAERVRRSAHNLKGAIGNFLAHEAYAAAERLETLGEGLELSRGAEAYRDLERKANRLVDSLNKLLAGIKGQGIQG
jgi:CheY-like chemotaxis protein